MTLNFPYYLLFLFFFTGCHTNDRITSEKEKSLIEQSIRQTLNDYYREIKQYGLNAEFKYLDSSSAFFWVPPGSSMALSYDSIRSLIENNAAKFKSVDNTWESLHIILLDKLHATYTGQLKSKMTDTSDQVFDIKLVESGVLIKRKDGWRLLGGQTAVIEQ